MSNILIPVALCGGMGLILSVVLVIAAKLFEVPVNEIAEKARGVLPGANCGACGYAGCDDYAAALAEGRETKINLCIPGANGVAQALSDVMGVEFEAATSRMAVVRCSGTRGKTSYVMDYQGLQSCKANRMFYRGRGSCGSGCLGFGDCAKVCQFNAIVIENGVAVVDRTKCTGCGMCAKICPVNIIDIMPQTARVIVGCASTMPAAQTKDGCDIGCVGCGICMDTCKFDAIKVENNCAVIDYDKCKNCGLCAKKCPRHIIRVLPKMGTK
ncbi:MAG: RnfABCDGE type electron transport complex subunit B [Clostridiales bacterium]|nr:RnfABCDGE type electron transport complex subunit B [Clostridiales bacterium]